MFSQYRKIFNLIKKYPTIVIARHIGADPDALASSIALRDVILNTFPKKKVYAVGTPVSRFKYLGILDKVTEDMYDNSLLIVVDTPNQKRVDGVDPTRFSHSIKIDHHPYIETFCQLEWIDDTASSVSQMIIELIFHTKLVMTKEAAEKLFLGVVADTNRFLFYYTTSKTFHLIAKLMETTNLDITSLYEPLYLHPLKEVKFEGFLANHLTITENGFAYMKITDDILKEYNVDAATARNMVANFNYIDEILVWAILTVDTNSETIRGSIRSRGPIINEIASHFNGGGHIYASGIRLNDEDELDLLVTELEEACKNYKEGSM